MSLFLHWHTLISLQDAFSPIFCAGRRTFVSKNSRSVAKLLVSLVHLPCCRWDTKCDKQPAWNWASKAAPRTRCSILRNLSSVTCARSTQLDAPTTRPVSGKSCNPRELTFWEDGKGGVAVRQQQQRRGGSSWRRVAAVDAVREPALQLSGAHRLLCKRSQGGHRSGPRCSDWCFLKSHQPGAVSRGFPYKKFEVVTYQVCNWILWHTWKHLECGNPGSQGNCPAAKNNGHRKGSKATCSCLWPNKEINEKVIKQNTEGLFSSFFTTSRESEWQLKGNNKKIERNGGWVKMLFALHVSMGSFDWGVESSLV